MKHRTPDGLVRFLTFALSPCLCLGLGVSAWATGGAGGGPTNPPGFQGVVTVAAAQTNPRLFDKASNLAEIIAKTEEAAAAGAQLIVFPEMALTGYKFKTIAEALPYAETIPGPAVTAVAEVAGAHSIYVAFGMLERRGMELFDSVVLVGPEGYVGKYRKAHAGYLSESTFFSRGETGFPVFSTDIGRIALGICYDQTLPEGARVAALNGADILALSYADGGARWYDYVRSRAAENNVYAVGANRIGEERFGSFTGSSLIAGPGWSTLAQADAVTDTIIYAELDLGLLDKTWLAKRRPELYGLLAEPLSPQVMGLDFNPESQVFGSGQTVIVRAVTASIRRHTPVVAELLAGSEPVVRAHGWIGSQGATISMAMPSNLPVGTYSLRVTVAHDPTLSMEQPYVVKDVLRPRILGAVPQDAGAATKSTIYLGFDVDVIAASGIPVLVSDGTTTRTFPGKVNTTAEIDNRLQAPYTGLAADTAYTLTLPANSVFSAVSGAGNEAASFSFRTAPAAVTVKTAVVQMSPTIKAVAENLAEMLTSLDTAGAAGAKLVVLPELALSGNGFVSKEEALPYAEDISGPSVSAMAERAQVLGIYAAFGMLEKESVPCGGHGHHRGRDRCHRLFDTQVLVGPEGLVGKYRKAHLSAADERFLDAGNLPIAAFETAIGKVGLMVGDDVFYPEVARVLFLQEAAMVAMGANLTDSLWVEQARTRGGESKVYVIAANTVATGEGTSGGGLSLITGSTRTVMTQAGAEGVAIIYGSLNIETMLNKVGRGSVDQNTGKVRSTHYQLDRRPDLYESLTRHGCRR